MEIMIVLALSGVVITLSGLVFIQASKFMHQKQTKFTQHAEEALLLDALRRDLFDAQQVNHIENSLHIQSRHKTSTYIFTPDSVRVLMGASQMVFAIQGARLTENELTGESHLILDKDTLLSL